MSASASSATLMLFAPGAFMTTMPRSVAAGTSTLSTPVPARATTLKRGAAAMSAAVTLVALRTTSASASARSRVELLGRAAAAGVDGPSWDAAKQFDGGGGKLIGDDDVHDSMLLMVRRMSRGAVC